MIPIEGQPILTAAQMRAAEERAIAAGSSVEELMERAGASVAEAVRRLAMGAPVLVLCGPGNNGGDGYVAARILKANGVEVHVAASAVPQSDAAKQARAGWEGPVCSFEAASPSPIVVDSVFGIGMSRPFPEDLADRLNALIDAARLSIAVDVPSGVNAEETCWPGAPSVDLTLAIGALKRAHLDDFTAGHCGIVRILDIGLEIESDVMVLDRPDLPSPGLTSHKYSRGMVGVVSGAMPGAALLAAGAAQRSGAGYVVLADANGAGPASLVHRSFDDLLGDKRLGSLVVGPGLGRGDRARMILKRALASAVPLVIDGDALGLLDNHASGLGERSAPTVITPHDGEFERLFGAQPMDRVGQTEMAAMFSGATVVRKGPFTVIAQGNGYGGRAVVSPQGSVWLSTAGTGDVLAGAIGAQLAAGVGALDAAAAGVWLHAEAARRLGGAFIADDLVRELSTVRASL
jgi:hydroxyethylthiazole kinase-like uncharacterized protein yjeF